jgi:hypothetical protein
MKYYRFLCETRVKNPRSFRLTAGYLHFHRLCNFTEIKLATVKQTRTIHAGRNVPVKEFLYVTIIIVGTAISLEFKQKRKLISYDL